LGGVVSGETIKIYTDSTCTQLMEVPLPQGKCFGYLFRDSCRSLFFLYKFNEFIGHKYMFCIAASYQYLGVYPTVTTSIALLSPAASPGYDSRQPLH